MSDIYLAVSETPTVVTLTSAVINSAAASSVTVTNTVTVALDANSLSALENVTVTVGAAITGTVTVSNFPATQAVSLASVPTHAISGTVTAVVLAYDESNDDLGELRSYSIGSRGGALQIVGPSYAGAVTANTLPCVPIFGSVTIGSALPAGTNSIGVVTIGAGTVTIGAGTAQIGTVTANTFAVQGTAVTTSNFTSTTASTVLASFNATREVLTIFNEGAGNLHICAGATCTTIAYQVRLSSGDYYEVPNHQTTITHSAVFATAGTARVCQVS